MVRQNRFAVSGILIVAVAVMALGAGCSGQDGSGGTRYVTVGTGGMGGVYYPAGGAIANESRPMSAGTSSASENGGPP